MADVLFIGAHPDDVEILGGGLVASLVRRGYKVVIADATGGEMGSRGTPEERRREATAAGEVLGIAKRLNLRLPDGRIADELPQAVHACVHAIREHRPRLVITHEPGDHHPDHNALAEAVKRAIFSSYTVKYDTGQERHRVHRLLYMVGRRTELPERVSFVADVSDVWETKMESLRSYTSQLHNPNYKGADTFVSSDLAWRMIEARGMYFGSLIGVKYGEAYLSQDTLRVDDPVALL
ncbi:MAG: bacillithiol biosynthesis deacetylase BshB1 [Sumerlaeia bacterium]